MPLYEYRCKDCGEEFEKQMRFSEADQLPPCPACSGVHTQKRLSRVISFQRADAAAVSSPSASSCGSSGAFT